MDVAYILEFYSENLALIMDLAEPNIWVDCLQEYVQFFQMTMLMAMENLFVAQHHDTLHYARNRSGA